MQEGHYSGFPLAHGVRFAAKQVLVQGRGFVSGDAAASWARAHLSIFRVFDGSGVPRFQRVKAGKMH